MISSLFFLEPCPKHQLMLHKSLASSGAGSPSLSLRFKQRDGLCMKCMFICSATVLSCPKLPLTFSPLFMTPLFVVSPSLSLCLLATILPAEIQMLNDGTTLTELCCCCSCCCAPDARRQRGRRGKVPPPYLITACLLSCALRWGALVGRGNAATALTLFPSRAAPT